MCTYALRYVDFISHGLKMLEEQDGENSMLLLGVPLRLCESRLEGKLSFSLVPEIPSFNILCWASRLLRGAGVCILRAA